MVDTIGKMGIVVIIIFLLLISLLFFQILVNKSKSKYLEQVMAELDVNSKRFKAIMRYIPCDVYQFELDTEKLYQIDRNTGDKVYIPIHDDRERMLEKYKDNTLNLGVISLCKGLKKRILAGEDSVVEIIKGYSNDEVKWSRFTATTVYNSVATPIQAICILEDIEDSSGESIELRNKLTAALKSTYNQVYEIDLDNDAVISLYQAEPTKDNDGECKRFSEMVLENANNAVHPDSRILYLQTLNRTLLKLKLEDEGSSIYFEYDVKEPLSGEYHHYSYLIQKVSKDENVVLGFLKDITKEIKEKEFLIKKSQVDPLTGLYNKEAFYEEGQKRINANAGKEGAVIFMDLDNFKTLNDTYGHFKGDEAIVAAATKLKVLFSKKDIVARFGGDEFCVLFMDADRNQIIDRLELLISTMREVYDVGKGTVEITTSMGIASIPQNGTNLKVLTNRADKALYYAKESGKNQFTFFEDNIELTGYVGRNE